MLQFSAIRCMMKSTFVSSSILPLNAGFSKTFFSVSTLSLQSFQYAQYSSIVRHQAFSRAFPRWSEMTLSTARHEQKSSGFAKAFSNMLVGSKMFFSAFFVHFSLISLDKTCLISCSFRAMLACSSCSSNFLVDLMENDHARLYLFACSNSQWFWKGQILIRR